LLRSASAAPFLTAVVDDHAGRGITAALATLDLPCVGIDREVPDAPIVLLGVTRHEEARETAFISAVRRRRMDGLLLFAGDNAHAG